MATIKNESVTCPGCGKLFKSDEPHPDITMCEICERYGKSKNEDMHGTQCPKDVEDAIIIDDELLSSIYKKINEGTVTCDDFNDLIRETTPESVRDRIRRRTTINNTSSHIDKNGHQQLKLPQFQKRIAPKRTPPNQQDHGRSKIAHKHSARTQKRSQIEDAMKGTSVFAEIMFVVNNIGKHITESDLSMVNRHRLLMILPKMMTIPGINRDWLFELHSRLEAKHG